ncbi:MAG: hypothetical protein AAF579_20070 [Cyanobacteria bacterium P01_C01_bin.118]
MQFKLALSTAILGTITVAISGYAKTSSPLASTQARTCPALTGESLTNIELAQQSLAFADETDTATANQILAITAFCNGYGYGGATAANPADLNPTTPAESGSLLYDASPTFQTPQAAAEFDQLPQDRIEFKAPL